MASFQILFKCPTPAFVLGNARNPSRFNHIFFLQGAQSLAPATRNDIWTSKSAPYPSVFYTFDLEMCFAPQPRALVEHLNVKNCSERGVFCTFWLRNLLRATTACTRWTSQRQKVLWTWCVLYMLTSKSASRHNGMHFFNISTSKTALNVACFVHWLANVLRAKAACNFSSLIWPHGSAHAALARPSGATNHWKNTVNRNFPIFSRAWTFFLLNFSSLIFFLLFSSLTLPIPAFHLSILSEVWLLNILRLYAT